MKGVKAPSEQIFIFVFYVIACDLKISIYKVNSPHKQKVYSLELFLVIKHKKNNICSEGPFTPLPLWIYVCF